MHHRTGRRKSAWTGLVLAFAALWGGSGPAAAAAPARIAALNYDVYVGGLHIFAFTLDMNLEPGRYRMTAEGGTRGMVGWLYTWDLDLATEGVDRDGRIAPQHYVAETQWQDRQRKLDLGFAADGRYTLAQDPPPEPDPDIEGGLPDSLPNGIVDPLSFALTASRALEKTGSCNQTVPIFDGQRRFDAIVKHLGSAVLPPNAYSIYQGPAVRCSLAIDRISGFRKSMTSRAPNPTTPPTIWMASLRPGLPPVPVRYEGEIALGKIVVHLTGADFRAEATPR